MSGKAYCELQGAADIRKAFRGLNAQTVRAVKDVTRDTVEDIRREARSRINVSTNKSPKNKYPSGTTRSKVRRWLSKDGLSGGVFSKWFVARFLERGTVKMAARPWLFPAFEVVRPKYLQRLNAAIYGVVRGAMR